MTTTFLSFDELVAITRAVSMNRLSEYDHSRLSGQSKRINATAGVAAALLANQRSISIASDPFNAQGADAIRWGKLRNVTRKPATVASGTNAGKITGTASSTWATSDLLEDTATNKQYAPASGGTVAADGSAVVSIVAIEAGSGSVLEAGATLTWVSTPAGLDDTVSLVAALDDDGSGLDEEDIETFRLRYLAAWAQQPAGGTPADYKAWALESSSDIVDAFVWRGRNGQGTIDVAALKSGSGATRLLDAGERTALLSYLTDGSRSPTPDQVRVLEVTTEDVNLQILISPESAVAGNAKDWDDSTPPTVSSYNSGTKTLTFAAARPASMAAGHRLVVDGTPGKPLTIASLSSTDAVVLDDDLGYTLTSTEEVYAGGALTEPSRALAQAFVDALGPRRGLYAAILWTSTLFTGRLDEAVQVSDGVLDTTVELPASDTEPTEKAYPDDSAVNLLVPNQIIVRYE